ncbi:unnamed protein product [Parnassius mnemosyne]|uniref:Uncharacterized protein n=1 Tax=Parnassius mnemosyne TaxID=213953 RepID=A0AAV1KFL7_9NEOP
MREWNIDHKITAIASDNAANITAATREGDWRQIPCFAHTLNLCVQSALQQLAPVLNKVKSVVEFFKRNTQANQKLVTMQKRICLPILKLKQDVATRRNSTYDMLHRFSSTKDAIIATIALIKPDLALTDYKWMIIKSVHTVLKMFMTLQSK